MAALIGETRDKKYLYTLLNKRNFTNEFVIRCYKLSPDGVEYIRHKLGDYFTDDWGDAVNTFNELAQYGTA